MKSTRYFLETRLRADRAIIRDEWINKAVRKPSKEVVQSDGRIRRWALIDEAGAVIFGWCCFRTVKRCTTLFRSDFLP